MLNRTLVRNIRLARRPLFAAQQVRFFSAEEAEKPAAEQFSKEELEKGRQQWGIQYDDECLKFEKEWEEIARKVQDEQAVFLSSELGDLQKTKVDVLVDKVSNLNLFELQYFQVQMEKKVAAATGLSPMKLNLDWPSVKQDSTGSWPPANPNWFK